MIQGCNIKLLYLEVISLNLKLCCTILLHIPYLICGQINKTLIKDIYMSLYKKQEHMNTTQFTEGYQPTKILYIKLCI